ncbi:hypothetical protein TanjilG_04327 [Lupinus angustifolius]|uniref:Uncharacterized protein n=2 Tax=Lupinus angustifolius TaxID=3871 RepID=A0A4P1RPI8_LUPAN|nr:hypothetical protein TanjilG_04327 [Lupinus angustifolius]
MARVFLIYAVAVLTVAVVVVSGSPATMTLERAFPSNDGVELSHLRARDMFRHRRMLKSSNVSVVDFSVQGTFNPYEVG